MKVDYLVIGAGIVGLTIARELANRFPQARIDVLEKENRPGLHSSGRNSGVLHSGIYYPAGTLKAQLCGQGARKMAAYCTANDIPVHNLGKLLVPLRSEDASQLDLLQTRAGEHGIDVERIDRAGLAGMEPAISTATGEALLVRGTSVTDPKQVMETVAAEVSSLGVNIRTGVQILAVDADRSLVKTNLGDIRYGHVVNAAGLFADHVAHMFGVGEKYELLPFKGIYWKLDPASGIRLNHLVYPTPDLRVPFLGVHTTTAINGDVYIGPTAVPAWSRENYRKLDGVTPAEFARISGLLARQFIAGRDGFRRLAWQEGRRYFKPWFLQAAKAILPDLRSADLLPTAKVGIRAQMLDKSEGKLVNDFLVETGHNSTHVLNAISPAFTSSFPFARFIVETYLAKE